MKDRRNKQTNKRKTTTKPNKKQTNKKATKTKEKNQIIAEGQEQSDL